MNLHINKKEFDFLIGLEGNCKFTVGSKLYGLNDEESDTDFLVITPPFVNKIYSPFNNHHQFQYKDLENNIDYNFIDIVTFLHNLVNGDSTINFELLYSEEFEASKLGWLTYHRESFHTYNVIKSYLGLVDRDIRHFHKRTGRDRASGYLHIMRGSIFADLLIRKDYDFSLNRKELIALKATLKEESEIQWCKDNLPRIRQNCKELREELNVLFHNTKQFKRYLHPELQLLINNLIISWCKGFKDLYLPDSLLMKLFQTNEKIEIEY
jgi:predicted nucleotidyltransferase